MTVTRRGRTFEPHAEYRPASARTRTDMDWERVETKIEKVTKLRSAKVKSWPWDEG